MSATARVLIAQLELQDEWLERHPPESLLARWLSGAEIDRCRAFRRAGDRWRMIGGRFLLHCALRRCFGVSALRLARGPNGKPIMAEYPLIEVNLAHDELRVLAALSDTGQVGIDICHVGAFANWEEFSGGYLAKEELDWVKTIDATERPARAARLWALKEAILKATGHGMLIDPRGLHLQPEHEKMIRRIPKDLPSEEFALLEWTPAENWRAALAYLDRENRPTEPHIEYFQLKASDLAPEI